jgi:hypothetical protein
VDDLHALVELGYRLLDANETRPRLGERARPTPSWRLAWPVTNHANAKLGTDSTDLMSIVTVVG